MKLASSTDCCSAETVAPERACITVEGTVQGVGFRPFVFRLATELALAGWVRNSPAGVAIEVEGPRAAVEQFLERLAAEKPPCATVQGCGVQRAPPCGYDHFEIRDSEAQGTPRVAILPDLAPCPDCRRELFAPGDRRYRYPFINCTRCGPRFSIVESLPYDRPNTVMRRFTLCPECAAEYDNPVDRRFHAQPTACVHCGPQLALWDRAGGTIAVREAAAGEAGKRLRGGEIVALKGVGGFQLLVDARNDGAVDRLRERKHRPAKPFAVMVPDVAAAREICRVSPLEAELLGSAAAPIVLLHARPVAEQSTHLAPCVAPRNPLVGVMLPSSPLHHLLLADLGFPIVATSGNRADEPICTDENEALVRLRGVADVFLVHDRPIARPIDDSVVRELLGREQVLRRARGYAPQPIRLPAPVEPVLALGADLKNTVALAVDREVYVSQHFGDLESPQALGAFQRATADLPRLYATTPARVACDLHPNYVSTHFAREMQSPVVRVPHHLAHVLAGMAEHGLSGPVLGICWDGTGYGPDGTIWGGEFLRVDADSCERVGHFRTFYLPGGDAAAREPRRSALGVMHALHGDDSFSHADFAPLADFSPTDRRVMRQMFARRINTVATSSAGRLFDAVASILGLCQRASFEGEAAMALEFAIEPGEYAAYPISIRAADVPEFDWAAMVDAICRDVARGAGVSEMAGRFHATLVEVIVAFAQRTGLRDVVLTGGCFQNAWLMEHAVDRLRHAGFLAHWPQRIPPNDGGVSLGQVLASTRPHHVAATAAAKGFA